MSSVHMALVVTRKEVKNIFRNRGLLFAGLYIGVMFGALNVLLLGQVSAVNNTAYSVALLVGVFVGYSFSGSVFLREKRDRVIETLLCTPLSLKSIWSGKVFALLLGQKQRGRRELLGNGPDGVPSVRAGSPARREIGTA